MSNDSMSIVLAALSDPVRRNILQRLQKKTATVNEIAVEYDMSLAAVSKHLKVLHEAALVSKQKHGRHVYVSTNREGFAPVVSLLEEFELISEGKR